MSESSNHSSKYESRRDEIVDVAAALFARQGYAGTGVVDIGNAAGLGKGGLYYYIGSKEALLVEIHERVMAPLLDNARRVVALDIAAPARLRLLSEVLLTAIMSRLDHVWVFLHEHRSLVGDDLQQFRARRREFEDHISAVMREAVEEGSLVIDDVRLATLAFLGMHNYTYQWVHTDGPLGPQELSAAYCRILFGGMATPTLDLDAVEADAAAHRSVISDPTGT